jgi:hypothetical protein
VRAREVVKANDIRDDVAGHKLLGGVCRIGIIISTASERKQFSNDATDNLRDEYFFETE